MGIAIESDLQDRYLERWLQHPAELQRFVSRFLEATLPISEWTHRAHIGVAASLIVSKGRDEALRILRDAIPRYNVATGGANTESSGYHETLTVFWTDRIASLLSRLPESISRFDCVRVAVEAFGAVHRLDRAFYSFDVTKSSEARRSWVAPDLL